MTRKIYSLLFAATTVAGCFSNPSSPNSGDDGSGSNLPDAGTGSGSGSGSDAYTQQLNNRQYNYNAALRIAAVRLTGSLPTVAEVTQIATASGQPAQAAAYDAIITDYLTRPTFATQMINFWRDTFKEGGTAVMDTAPVFAAELSVQNGSYTDLFTAGSGNCPTYDGTTNTFTPAECGNGGPVAGVLTNPGVMQQFFSNFAFRRVRWIQEIFVCNAFPTEFSTTPQDVGGASPYTGAWPFDSIAGTSDGGRINFLDTSSIICANCHTTINHIAPLFAFYDGNGMYQTSISVPTPLSGAPLAMLSDYLPAGQQQTAWRYGKPVNDIPSLGAAMAADTNVQTCGVARIWNWALGKTDIVDTLEIVPPDVIASQVAAFQSGGFKLRDLIHSVYTSDDFVKF